ncbi:MAG TPA: fused MFS/spermidine synthase [Candidatus Sulfotelmatobacter sp.]|nr:fused MFS/spermidine synthase [Candidatus Sulfotelmatobacter sp.]
MGAIIRTLFSVTLFLAAALLFWIQLLIAKLLLPVLGGSAAVWNTALMFFQTALLGGYLYAHVSTRWLGAGRQMLLHLALLALAALTLPIALRAGAPPTDGSPVAWLLGTLALMVGPPFVILAATAPMLQRWYAATRDPLAKDPYFLYAASNLGSLLGLLSYPTLIEPRLHLLRQNQGWSLGYLGLMALTAACALAVRAPASAGPALSAASAEEAAAGDDAPVAWIARLRWIVLAAVPSSLLLGVTSYLTTDVAAAPLFWVIPLALYLLAFVLAFQRTWPLPIGATTALQSFLLPPLALLVLMDVRAEPAISFPLHLAAFFVTALLCNQELARTRPPAARLTEYYLLISFGGALGGAFNALLAPVLFNDVYEYPLALVAACLLRPGLLPTWRERRPALADFLLPVVFLAALVALPLLQQVDFSDLSQSATLTIVAAAAVVAYGFRQRPVRFGLALAAILFAGVLVEQSDNTLLRVRNFYGVLRVVDEDAPPSRTLYHGTTLHGEQSRDPARRLQPLSYYHPTGPLGQLFARIGGSTLTGRVAAVGLGAGTIACYGKAGEHWTFFEINPAVVGISREDHLFSFLADCPPKPDIVMGDARLSLAREPDGSFGLIILDAFSSDAIPVHLITREAVQLYLAKLRPGGLVVFHVSNRHLDLHPVLANIAADLHLALRAESDDDSFEGTGTNDSDEKAASDWVVVARRADDLAFLAADGRWTEIEPDPAVGLWSDDYSNLLSVLK